MSPNCLSNAAIEACYTYGDEWVDQQNAYLTENAEFIIHYLAVHAPEIKPVKPEGTYLMWLDCSALEMTSDEIQKTLADHYGIAVGGGLPMAGRRRAFSCGSTLAVRAKRSKRVWKSWYSLYQTGEKGYNIWKRKTEFLGLHGLLYWPDRRFRCICTDSNRNRTDRTRRPYGYFLAAIISLISLIPMATLFFQYAGDRRKLCVRKKLLGPRSHLYFF